MFPGMRVELLSAVILPLGIGLAVHGAHGSTAPATGLSHVVTLGPVSYAEQIAPIFEERCAECHGGDTKEAELGLLTYEELMKGSEYGTVIEAGEPEESLLLDMIIAGEMPEEGDPVPPEEIALIRTWIAEGAQDN